MKSVKEQMQKPALEGANPAFSGPRTLAAASSAMTQAGPQIAQLHAYHQIANAHTKTSTHTHTHSGLPHGLQTGIESLSGISMHDVRVHYNSAKPAQLQAHAYAQGTDIHLAAGQEKHLPHEAWHVVQQKQGRVKPTLQLKGIAINDDSALEREADVMGARAMAGGLGLGHAIAKPAISLQEHAAMPIQQKSFATHTIDAPVVQRHIGNDLQAGTIDRVIAGELHHSYDPTKEKELWAHFGVDVKYEEDEIESLHGFPDPPALRVAYLSTALIPPMVAYWKAIAANAAPPAEATDLETQKKDLKWIQIELLNLIKDDETVAEVAGNSIKEIDKLLAQLPATKAALDAMPQAGRLVLAKQIAEGAEFFALLFDVILSTTKYGKEAKVSYNKEELRLARSIVMAESLKRATEKKLIYKVGNSHVADMLDHKMDSPKIRIINMGVYDAEYMAAATEIVEKGLD
jgi:hypothetical protein